MNANFLKKLLVLATGMFMTTAAWANTTIGATDTGWDNNTSCTSAYTLEAGKTLTFEFTVDATRGTYVADGWVTILCSTATRNEGANHYVFMRDDCYGVNQWDWTNKTTNQSGWFITNENNYDWTDFQANIINGASVVQTIRRYGTEAFIITDVTTKTSAKYRHYFVMDLGTTNDIYAFLASDYAQLTITSDAKTDSPAPTLTGTLVGKLDKTGRLANHGDIVNFTLAPESSMSLSFELYSTKLFDWAHWLYEIQQDDKLYTLSVGNQNSWNDLKEDEVINKTNWPATTAELLEKMDGATVTMTVTRTGATVTMTAVHTPVSGDPFTITASVTPTKDGFATKNITIRPLVELGYLDLQAVTKTMTSAGWATYCSSSALNLAGASAELTDAYIITGGADGKVTTTSVKGGTVPAGTGLLLKGTEGTITIPIANSGSTDVSANKLVGVFANTDKDQNTIYVLMNDATNGIGFYKNSNAIPFTVGAYTAYLPANFDGGSGARAFYSLFDDATGIKAVTSATVENGVFFDLQGRRIANPTKGIYIVNGKKVAIK